MSDLKLRSPPFPFLCLMHNASEVDYQSERIAALRVNLDDQSLVDFSDSGASFHFTVMPGENAWRCPFCGASFSLGKFVSIFCSHFLYFYLIHCVKAGNI